MFDVIRYRKINTLYYKAIDKIRKENYVDAYIALSKVYNIAKKLQIKMHTIPLESTALTQEQWSEVERILLNSATLLAYDNAHDIYLNYIRSQCAYDRKEYDEALTLSSRALRYYKYINLYPASSLNEPKLMNIQEKSKYHLLCWPARNMQSSYSIVTKKEFENILQENHNMIDKAKNENQQSYNSYNDYDNSYEENETNYELEDAKKSFKETIEKGDSWEWHNPKEALDYYKSAYNIAKRFRELEDETEKARKMVVDCYVNIINKTLAGAIGTDYGKMSVCESAINICNQAENWTTSYDYEKIASLKRQAQYEYDQAHRSYMYDD